MVQLTKEQAEGFYAERQGKPFLSHWWVYDVWTGGFCVGKRKCRKDYRTLIGATNPAEGGKGTIRKDFALSQRENSVHGSDMLKAQNENYLFLRRFRNPTIIHFYEST